jgi:amidohydrolase
MLDLIKIRQYLHQHPELSGVEKATQQYIIKQLKCIGLSSRKIGRTGVIVSIGSGEVNSMVRVDIDALPIKEINTFKYKSETKGISHMCGHDGHTTIGIGLAQKLLNNPIKGVIVHVLFQPSEENGLGANWVINDIIFKSLNIDYIIALHNVPGYDLNKVIIKNGAFTPAVQSLKIELIGKTSHAAEPEYGLNPHKTIAYLISKSNEMENTNRADENFILFTPIFTNIGTKNYGISPGKGEIHFTIRSWNQNVLEAETEKFIAFAKEIASTNQLTLNHSVFEKFYANNNNSSIVNTIAGAAKSLKLDVLYKSTPFSWGEDFGLFTQRFPGAMFGLGAGKKTPALHNPDYDFPDEIIDTGVNLFYDTILKLQHAK